MLDSDLAEIYGVPTFRLNECCQRNHKRFPADFMLQLSRGGGGLFDIAIAMSKAGRGGRRTLPYAFTEHGVAMLASVLNSDRAAQMNIVIIRAFVNFARWWQAIKNSPARLAGLTLRKKRQGSIILG